MKTTKLFQALFARTTLTQYADNPPKEVKVKNTTPRKQPYAGYSHVSTKVVTYKDETGVMREAIVGVTAYGSGKKLSRRKMIRAAGGKSKVSDMFEVKK
jgi:hypothetical protein